MNLTKRNHVRSKKILAAANGEPCTWPGCGIQDGTVVAAHSNLSADGKGLGMKAEDIYVAFLCHQHHMLYDSKKKMMLQEDFDFAMKRTWRVLIDRGIIKL